MSKNYDIFISFKDRDNSGNPTKDSEIVERLEEYLNSKGLKVFYAKDRVDAIGADELSAETERALRSSKVFIALGSREEFFLSKWLQIERRAFLKLKAENNTKVICSYITPPMQTENLPDDLASFPSFQERKDGIFDDLYDFISGQIGHKTEEKTADHSGKPTSKRYTYAGLSIIVALLAIWATIDYKNIKEKENGYKFIKVKKRSKTAGNYLDEGNTYSDKGDLDKAIELYQKSLSVNPRYDKAYFNMGNMYRRKKEYDKAIELYKKAIELNPKKDDAYFYMARTYGYLKEYDNAIKAYKKSVAINPSRYVAYYNIGDNYLKLNKYSMAIEFYKKATGADPKDASAYYALGYTYNQIKEYDKAIEAYEKAIIADPKYENAYYSLGYTYDIMGKYDKAIKFLEISINLNLKSDQTYRKLGDLYYKMKEYDKAAESYEKSSPQNNAMFTYDKLAKAYAKAKKYDLAIAAYRKSWEANSFGVSQIRIFEIQLIQNQPFDKALEKQYIEFFSRRENAIIFYDMVKVLQDIQNHKQVDMEQWRQKYGDVSFKWDFELLQEWIDGHEESETKRQLAEALKIFNTMNSDKGVR